MILSRTDLRALIDRDSLAFRPPLEDQQIGAAAIDLRLGYNFAAYPTAPAGLAGNVGAIVSQTVDLGNETLVVEQGLLIVFCFGDNRGESSGKGMGRLWRKDKN